MTVRNTVTEERENLKFEARDQEGMEKAVQDARNRLDKNQLAENEHEMTEVANSAVGTAQEVVRSPQVQSAERVVEMPIAHQGQLQHMSSTVKRNVETTRKQSPDGVVVIPMDMASPSATVEVAQKMAEVARVIPLNDC